MTRQQFRKNERICMIIAVILAAILTVHMTVTTIRGNNRQQPQVSTEEILEKETQAKQEYTQEMQNMQQEAEPDKYAVFDEMSEDWGADDIEGFVFYEIPEEFAKEGGYLPEKMQIYTYCICRQYGVKYELVIALIENESGYEFDKVGDDGHSIGYMQIYEKWHTDRMEQLGCNDLTNPYQNIRVGVDFLAELHEKYGTWQDTLTAYNYGEAGAYKHMWSKGKYVYPYNSGIMKRMKEIEGVVGDGI